MDIKRLEYNIRKLERGAGVAQREDSRKPKYCESDYQSVIDSYEKQIESMRNELERLTGNREPSTPKWPL
jgi:hypothetical protein